MGLLCVYLLVIIFEPFGIFVLTIIPIHHLLPDTDFQTNKWFISLSHFAMRFFFCILSLLMEREGPHMVSLELRHWLLSTTMWVNRRKIEKQKYIYFLHHLLKFLIFKCISYLTYDLWVSLFNSFFISYHSKDVADDNRDGTLHYVYIKSCTYGQYGWGKCMHSGFLQFDRSPFGTWSIWEI